MEVSTVIAEAKSALSELDEWMQPTSVRKEANKFRSTPTTHVIVCAGGHPAGCPPGS